MFFQQFRPAVYFSRLRNHVTSKGTDAETVEPTPSTSKPVDPRGLDPKEGITLELCAGIVDKSKVIARLLTSCV